MICKNPKQTRTHVKLPTRKPGCALPPTRKGNGSKSPFLRHPAPGLVEGFCQVRSGVLLSQNGVLWVRPGHIQPDRAFWTTIGPHGAAGREQTAGTWVVCATSATPQGPRGGCGSLQGTVGAPQVPKIRNGSVSAISLNGTEPPSQGGRGSQGGRQVGICGRPPPTSHIPHHVKVGWPPWPNGLWGFAEAGGWQFSGCDSAWAV